MNTAETIPTEKVHTSSVPLDLGTDQRLNLVHELRGLSNELQENLFSTPATRKVNLKGISVRSQDVGGSRMYMELETIRPSTGPSASSISLSGNRPMRIEQRSYIHRPSFDVWEEWRPGASEPRSLISSRGLISLLEPLLPEETFEPIADTDPSGAEVASLLADYLKKKARTRTETTHYKAHNVLVGLPDFTRDTDFVVRNVNERVTRGLYIAASFLLDDYGHLRKAYSFETSDNHGNLKSANGSLRVSATEAVPKARLDAFAQRDQIRNDPSLGLTLGIADIRRAHLL